MKNSVLMLLAVVLIQSVSSSAWAIPQISYAIHPDLAAALSGISDYQMGSEWGKYPVTQSTISSGSAVYRRATAATAFIPVGGTGFYLGRFNGVHVMATNHHVCPRASACVGQSAVFKVLGRSYKMLNLLMTNPNIDLSLVELQVPASDETALISVGRNFSFRKNLVRGEKLITVGFGIANNPDQRSMMANQDSDCVVYSNSGDYRLMADPDDFNPAPYKAWSFAHACDVSHGDSGSAMVDRDTSEVVGIVWTGRIPKDPRVQNSSYLRELPANHADIWGQLAYAVPAVKIGEYLAEAITQSSFDARTRAVFGAMLKSK